MAQYMTRIQPRRLRVSYKSGRNEDYFKESMLISLSISRGALDITKGIKSSGYSPKGILREYSAGIASN